MITRVPKSALATLSLTAFAILSLAACGDKDEASSDASFTADAAPTADAEPTEQATEDPAEASVGALFPGTGSYAIGVDIPLGGFQVLGEPVGLPDGCTWSIVDEDGAVYVENQGVYVFLTNIPEAVTFITNGCPEWEQFE